MSKQISIKAAEAFNKFQDFKRSNTEVTHMAMVDNFFPQGDHFIALKLHGNIIAIKDSMNGRTYIRNCDWPTRTTKDRLNALGAGIYQKNFQWFFNGVPMSNKNWYLLK